MLYLIETLKYYKIGYTKNIENRMKLYSTYNKEFKLIDHMNGDSNLENILHKLCSKYLYETEWFYKKSEVLEIWNVCKEVSKLFYEKLNSLQIRNEEIQNKLIELQLKNTKLENEFDRMEKVAKQAIKLCETQIENLKEQSTKIKEKEEFIID